MSGGSSKSSSSTSQTTSNTDKRVVADANSKVATFDNSTVAGMAPAINLTTTGGKNTTSNTSITMVDVGAIDKAMKIIGMGQAENAAVTKSVIDSQNHAVELFSANIRDQNAASLATMDHVAEMIAKSYQDIGDTALTAVEKAFQSADAIAATGLQFVKETQGAYADAAAQAQGNKNLVYAGLLIAGIVAIQSFSKG